jgi:two-component system nitrate/nitrite sensor histidine kinase NarX
MIITLAGRQRALIQQMTRAARELEFDRDDEQQHLQDLQEAAETFEQTLWALTNGGQAPYLPNQPANVPATGNPDIQLQLHQVHHTWDIFRGYLNQIVAEEPTNSNFTTAIRAAERLSPELLQEADEVVRQYQAAADDETIRLWWVEGALLIGAFILMGAAYLVTKVTFLNPLRTLESVVDRMGRGDLNTPVKIAGPREIEAIGHSLDTMRAQLKISQTEFIAWTEKLEFNVTQRTRELRAAFESSQEIVADIDLDQLLSSITERAKKLMEAQAARLCLVYPDRSEMVLAAQSGDLTISPDCQPSQNDQPKVQLVNIDKTVSVEMPCTRCDIPKNGQFHHCLATLLRDGERTLGALCVVRSESKVFDLDETRALSLLTNSAAIAISNAWLVETGRRHAEQAAALGERERLAADLHDNLAQSLSFLNLKADRLRELLANNDNAAVETELNRMHAALQGAYGQVRAALVGLCQPVSGSGQDPSNGSESGQALAKEIETYLAEFQETSGLLIELRSGQPAELALPHTVQRQVMHIVREALTNVRRHAQATRVWVHAEYVAENGEVSITVEDDGCGFDPARTNGDNHLGLTIMRARAERIGGRLTVRSAPGTGTKVAAHFPLDQA